MFQRIKDYISNSYHYMVMSRGAKFFDRNPVVQGRFEENEDWLELLEDRVVELEDWSHPPVAPGGATELKDEIHNLAERLKQIEEKLGIEYQHKDS